MGPGTWSVIPKATGPCGIVQLDRFESDSGFFNYIFKKAVTNPNGDDIIGNCDKWDENEYVYSWKSKSYPLECRYIEFSVL